MQGLLRIRSQVPQGVQRALYGHDLCNPHQTFAVFTKSPLTRFA